MVATGDLNRETSGIGACTGMRAAIADNGLMVLERVWVALVQAGHEVTAARERLEPDDTALVSADILLLGTTQGGDGIERLRAWMTRCPGVEAVVVIGPAGDVELKLAAFQAG